MILKSTSVTILMSALAVLSFHVPRAEAHSWMDCVDWRFNNPDKHDWSDQGGKCMGYARRFPLGKPFGTLDSDDPSRHYQQDGNPDKALPCSDHIHGKDIGADERRGNPPSSAYGGSFGRMTVANAGDTICVRWPAKTHAESNEDDTMVQINFSKNRDSKDPSQETLLSNTLLLLPFKNCGSGRDSDKRPCGGCFKVPNRANGIYLMQWRWMLNPGEWYTSCAVSARRSLLHPCITDDGWLVGCDGDHKRPFTHLSLSLLLYE